jgi:SagB-type dehydrogenase family enzyme
VLEKTQRVKLTQPRRDGPVALERCVEQRRSVRGFREQALAEHELGQLLWAAQGLTGGDAGRAAPSAGALYPLELSVAVARGGSLAAGIYRYLPERHELLPIAPAIRRAELVDAARGQDWIATAPAVICVAAVFERTTVKYGDRGRGYVDMEAGHAAQGLMLQAVALGLATTMVGAFSDGAVSELFHLGPDERPLCLIPVGRP